MLMPSRSATAVRAPRRSGESFIVIELPIARNYRVLVNHKRGEAFRFRTSHAASWAAFRAAHLSRDDNRRRDTAGRRIPPPAESHHLDRFDRSLDCLSPPDPVYY